MAALLGALLAPRLGAAVDRWTPVVGLDGGWITTLAAAPSARGTVYALTYDGMIYRSVDGAQSWALAGPGPAFGAAVQWMAVDPGKPGTIYLWGGKGLYRTVDSGTTWSLCRTDLGPVLLSPSSPGTLFANDRESELIRSDDGGVSWRTIAQGPLTPQLEAIDPASSKILYGQVDGRLYKSLNGGATWQRMDAGQPADFWYIRAIDPRHPNVVYASGFQVPVWKSLDGGATWQQAAVGVEAVISVIRLLISPSGKLYLMDNYGAVYVSTDGAGHWQKAGIVSGGGIGQDFTADFGSPDRLYASLQMESGVQRSVDGGRTWTPAFHGLTGLDVEQLVPSPGVRGAIYATADGSVVGPAEQDQRFFASKDGGVSWRPLAPSGLEFESLTLDAAPGVLYTTGFDVLLARNIIARSTNDGASWQSLSTGGGEYITALTADPSLGGKLWALGLQQETDVLRLLHSTNSGNSWSLVNQIGRPLGGTRGAGIFLDSGQPARLYLGLQDGSLFGSTDGGATLNRLAPPGPVVALAVDPSGAGTLYAATTRPRPLYRSDDGGGTWTRISLGLPLNTVVVALTVDPTAPTILYAATSRGFFESDDRGESWQLMDEGLAAVPLLALAAGSGTPARVYVGTAGAGAFSLTRPTTP
jgi:photosystem II stability/assembly factor-like uncharacterized protein